MTISVLVTETEINASIQQTSQSVSLTSIDINASVAQTPISASVSSSPVSVSVQNSTPISVAVSSSTIHASISSGGSGGVTDHSALSNLDYASAGHTGFQATLTPDVDYLIPATIASTYPNVTIGTGNGLSLAGQVLSLALASAGTTGALSSTDWSTFNSKLSDAPSDGSTYGRNNGAWTAVSSGVTDHSALSNLSYATAGHTGFQSALTFPLAPNLGGTGVDNGANLLTVPATGTAALLATANVFTATQTLPRIDLPLTSDLNNGVIYSGVNAFIHAFGNSNVFVGDRAGNFTLTGGFNVGVGTLALRALTSGQFNFALGRTSLLKLTSADGNIAIGGDGVLSALVTGNYNIAIGYNSLTGISGVTDNVAIGRYVGNGLINGSENTFIGSQSGRNVGSGVSNSIFIGQYSGRYITTSNRLVMDSQSRANEAAIIANSILYGVMASTPANQNLRVNALLQPTIAQTSTNVIVEVSRLQAEISTSSTGGAAGFGPAQSFYAETATDGTYQQQGLISTSWIDSTNVSRKAKMSLSAYDTAARLGLEIEADGSAAKLGFYGVTPITRSVLATGAGATADDIIIALQNLGLVKQS